MAATVKMTLRLDPSLYEAIRQKAERRRVPISTLITLALVDTFDPDEPKAPAKAVGKAPTKSQKRQMIRDLTKERDRLFRALCLKTEVPNGEGGVTDVNPDSPMSTDIKIMQEQHPAEWTKYRGIVDRIKQLEAELLQDAGAST